ncbi:RNA polymerase sigma factor [Stappia sp.]|uniref:RNA polymerase sigma factor n=1 Tax=Stappia sp. TaxID=1870903 RepID=UPI003A995267
MNFVKRLQLANLIGAFVKARPRLEAVAQARIGSRAIAEDLMQDVWLRLEAASLDAPIENPVGFVTRVARNTVTDHLRKERRRGEIDTELSQVLWEGAEEISPERTLIARQRLHAVCLALDNLPEKTRRIFLMNRIEHISHRKIAEKLGISDEAVYYHIRRALERLAKVRDTFDE